MPAKYPITRVQVKNVVLHSGIHGETIDNIFKGTIPRKIIVGFVKNQALNGSRKHNPLNFEHFDINYFSLSIDGVKVLSRQLQLDFEGNWFVVFHTLFTGSGIHFMDSKNSISRESFKNGYCLFVFDLTPDLSANLSDHLSVRIDVRFKTALAHNISCLVYAVFNRILEIDSIHQVITGFAN